MFDRVLPFSRYECQVLLEFFHLHFNMEIRMNFTDEIFNR